MDGRCVNLCHTPNFDSKMLRMRCFDVSAITPDSPIDYILEVDLEYPQHLHDRHIDLFFCPKHDKPSGKREEKLLVVR